MTTPQRTLAGKILREPLVHFLLLGAALFGLFALIGNRADNSANRVVITPGIVENLRLSFERNAQRAPSPEELDTAIEDYVREEILGREARALGLDRDDPFVRTRLRQRMEFLTEDSTEIPQPTESQLGEFFEEHAADFRREDGSAVKFDDVHAAVQRKWLAARRRDAVEAAYQKLREKYTVVIPSTESAKK